MAFTYTLRHRDVVGTQQKLVYNVSFAGVTSGNVDVGLSRIIDAHVTNETSEDGKIDFDPVTSAVAASKVIQDITYAADTAGAAGNSITITYVAGGTAGSEVVTVDGSDIEVEIEDGVSTATQVKAAIDGSTPAAALVNATITGTGSNAQDAVASTALENGADAYTTRNRVTMTSFTSGDTGILTVFGI